MNKIDYMSVDDLLFAMAVSHEDMTGGNLKAHLSWFCWVDFIVLLDCIGKHEDFYEEICRSFFSLWLLYVLLFGGGALYQ